MLALVVYYVATRGVFQGKASGDGFFGFHYLRALVFFRFDLTRSLFEIQQIRHQLLSFDRSSFENAQLKF